MRVQYDILDGLKRLRRDKFINTIVLLSFLLGFLFPILVFCIGSSQIHSLAVNLPLYPDRTGGFDVGFHPIDIDALLRENPQFEALALDNFPSHAVISGSNGFTSQCDVYGVDLNERKIWPDRVAVGRNFTQEELAKGEALCVVSLNFLDRLGGTGSTISLNGIPFKIIGAEDRGSAPAQTYVKLPSSLLKTMFPNVDYAYDCLMKKGYTFQKDGYEACAKVVSSLGLDPTVHVVSAMEYKKDDLANYYLSTAAFMGVVSLILLYSLLNIACVLLDKLEKEKRDYQVQFQLGARKGDVFLNLFTQLLVLGAAAVALDLAGIYLFSRLGGTVAGFALSLNGGVAVLAAGMMALCIALVSVRVLCPTIQSFYPKRARKRGK